MAAQSWAANSNETLAEETMTSVHTILHPTDFSRSAEKAFQAACSLARDRSAQLVLLHVLEPVRLSTEWLTVELVGPPKQERWDALRRLRMREADVTIEPVMQKGAPAQVILDVAREVPCDLIVLGVPGRFEGGVTAWSEVAAEVVGKAHCPVITLAESRPSHAESARERVELVL